MGITLFLILMIFWILIILFIKDNYLPGPWKNCPPGPLTFPMIGGLMSFVRALDYNLDALQFPLIGLEKLNKVYGKIFRINVGTTQTIFISDLEAMKQFSSLEDATERPHNETLLNMYSYGKPLGVGVGVGGPRWKNHRKFALNVFKEFGGGPKGMNDRILNEVTCVINDLKIKMKANGGIIKDADIYFDVPSLNVVWEIIAGIRYDYSDSKALKQLEFLRAFVQEPCTGPISTISWLKKLSPFDKIYDKIQVAMDDFRVMIKEVIQHQLKTHDPNNPRGYIDRFIIAQKDKMPYFTDEDLVICCQDFFIAGAETTSKTLSNAILFMVNNPKAQEEVQEEIDRVVGSDRLVNIQDRVNLPITDASLMEVRRYSTPFPITPPRITRENKCIAGYMIPAGVPVQMNLYSVLTSEDYWDEPRVFKPKRFIDKKGKLKIPEAFIPFGYGKRRCLGEEIAHVNNFLFFANLLQAYNFRCLDVNNPPTEIPRGGVTYGPQKYSIKISSRH